jgi:MoaA/NifB/PqqE/SkfB family radical SAM enzyme
MILFNELLPDRLIRSLTPRRFGNIIKSSASFILSALIKKPVVWGVPPVLTIEPTNLCNLHCPLCTTGAGEMKRTAGRMSLETYSKIIDHLGKEILFLLIYHQGEPYINEHFFDFIRIAKEKNIYVTTSTNGHYFIDQNITKTIDSGLDSMIISVDGATQQSYEKYRIGGNLDKVLEGTARLIQEKNHRRSRTPNVALQFLVMKHNECEIPEIKKMADQLKVDRLLIKNIEVRSLKESKEWLPENEKYRRYDHTGDQYIVKGANKKSCTRPWLSSLINWDGTFVPCCFDKNGEFPMGNANHLSSVDEMWRGSAFNDFRKVLLQNRKSINICRNCNQGFGSFLPGKIWNRKEKK